MNRIGMVAALVEPEGGDYPDQISRASQSVPDGRFFAVVWEIPHSWQATVDPEGDVINLMMGAPSERCEDKESEAWLLHATLWVRCYDGQRESNAPRRTFKVLILRRRGEPPRSRVKSAHLDVIEASRISVSDPVFPREVVNNVWHLWNESAWDAIVGRLSRLLAWDDETVVVYAPMGQVLETPVHSLSLAMDLIGRSEKVHLDWPKEITADRDPYSPPGSIALSLKGL